MAGGIRNLAAVREKSAQLQIPYPHLLQAFVLEEALLAVSESEEAEYFWLKNDSVLSIESYKRKAPVRLEYVLHSEEEMTVKGIIHRMSHIFENEERAEFWWKYRVEKDGEQIRVYLRGRMDELQIPVELLISRQEDMNLKPEEAELRLFLQNNQTVHYLHYPVEGMLAEHFIRILKDMELLNDLSSYYVIYDLLKKEMNSTRKVTEQIELLAKLHHIPVEGARFDIVSSYRESPYMKKRWKAYLKREKKQTPSFEEVMDILTAYFGPVWGSLEQGTYYLGDWMPELMRYLD